MLSEITKAEYRELGNKPHSDEVVREIRRYARSECKRYIKDHPDGSKGDLAEALQSLAHEVALAAKWTPEEADRISTTVRGAVMSVPRH